MGTQKSKRRNFSGFSLDEAFIEVQVEKLLEWQLEPIVVAGSDVFRRCCSG